MKRKRGKGEGDKGGDSVAVVRCMRVADFPIPAAGLGSAKQVPCESCGEAIWLSDTTISHVQSRTDRMMAYCTRCDVPAGELIIPPAQIDELRALGMSEQEVIFALALAKVSDGRMGFVDPIDILRAGIEGDLGQEFLNALAEMTALVRGHSRRN